MSKDTMVRLISAVIGLILFFIVIFASQLVLDIVLGALILFMLYEFFHAFQFGFMLSAVGLIGTTALLCVLALGRYDIFAFALTAYIVLLIAISIFRHKTISFTDITTVVFATIYVGFFTSFIARIRALDENGLYYLFLIFICAWMTDTGAYFSGRFFGKHKLAPSISPKKTVEGSVGGIICAMLGCIVLGLVAAYINEASPNYWLLALVGLIGSCLAQLGDLIASLIKRTCGVKDFGNIMPGHGGALDRFDSVIMVSPFIYYLCLFMMEGGMTLL